MEIQNTLFVLECSRAEILRRAQNMSWNLPFMQPMVVLNIFQTINFVWKTKNKLQSWTLLVDKREIWTKSLTSRTSLKCLISAFLFCFKKSNFCISTKILCNNNEKNYKFYRKVAFLMYYGNG